VSDAERHANRRRATTLSLGAGAGPGLVIGVVLALLVGWVVGLVALVVVTAGVSAAVWRGSTTRALRSLAARPPSSTEDPRLRNLVQGLCATMGLSEPDLLVIDDPVPNACALGRSPADATVVVTTGLLGSLELVELEGVVAHELAHVKRGDTTLAGVVLTVLGPLARISGDDALVHWALGAGREYRADQIAVSAVHYAPGLRDALAKMVAGPEPAPGSLFAGRRALATRWIFIDPMVGRRDEPAVGELDATGVRLDALHEW
jgi:heat shock protein HtpX